MTAVGPNLDIVIHRATEALDAYKSREFWEDRFRELALWPDMLRYDLRSQKYSAEIDTFFLNFQLVAALQSDRNRVAGIAHAVPLFIGDATRDLPDTGWDWALHKAVEDHLTRTPPDAICGLSITVLPEYQRCGVGRLLIQEVVQLAATEGFRNVVMPVRPISKRKYPSMVMEEFLIWRREDGFHYDPWIRAHEVTGGVVKKVCNRSMTIAAPISAWEHWCGRRFVESGVYPVKDGLAPVTIDLEKHLGVYLEPNIWVLHSCESN